VFMYYLIAVGLFFSITLFIPINHEEGNFTISALEMWLRSDWKRNTLVGEFFGRPPLLNYFIIAMNSLIGIKHTLLSSRIIAMLASFVTGYCIFALLKSLGKETGLALFAVVCYFTGDLLGMRGWLAYAEPLFVCFIWLACTNLWLAVHHQKKRYFLFSALFISLAYLTKALTCYMSFGALFLALLLFHPNRNYLFSKVALFSYGLIIATPILWDSISAPYFSHMIGDLTGAYDSNEGIPYHKMLAQLFFLPSMTLLRLFPFSILTLYLFIKKPFKEVVPSEDKLTLIVCGFSSLLVFCVFWFSLSQWTMPRYLMPIYPFMAIIFALLIWPKRNEYKHIIILGLVLTLLIKAGLTVKTYHKSQAGLMHARTKLITLLQKGATQYCFKGYKYYIPLDEQIMLHLVYLNSSPIMPQPQNKCVSLRRLDKQLVYA
jgi:4-amino-4-deoxy-L-arabinose transferase-like glycosyltransferase